MRSNALRASLLPWHRTRCVRAGCGCYITVAAQATLEDPFDSDSSSSDDIKLALFNLSGTAVAAARAPPPLKRLLSRAASSLRGAPAAPVEPFSRPASLGRRLSFLPGCHSVDGLGGRLGGGSMHASPAASPSASMTRLDTLQEKSAPPRCRGSASPKRGIFDECEEA